MTVRLRSGITPQRQQTISSLILRLRCSKVRLLFFPLFTRTITSTLTNASDATVSGHQIREDEVALFARFVRCVSTALPHLSPADWLQTYSRMLLRRYGEAMIQECLSRPTSTIPATSIKTVFPQARYNLPTRIYGVSPRRGEPAGPVSLPRNTQRVPLRLNISAML